MVLLAVLLAVVAVLAAWQHNAKAHWRAQFAAEAAERRAEERYRVTLMSIGDGVVVTDAEGRVELLNPVAEALTGWTNEEARGQPLETVFRIVKEGTREPVENPVSCVVREGVVIGLANHTVLIARDGAERPIADSGASIHGEDGADRGAVLVFRDRTEQRRSEERLAASELRYRRLFETAKDGILILDAETGTVVDANPFLVDLLGFSHEEFLGKKIWELGTFKDIAGQPSQVRGIAAEGIHPLRRLAPGNRRWPTDQRGIRQQRLSGEFQGDPVQHP